MNRYIQLFVILFLFTEVSAQDWENLAERERKVYLSGWYGIIEISRVRIAEYYISDQRPAGVCGSPFVHTFYETMDSLSTYHFRPADMDSLIYLIDEILLLNKNRQEILREAIKYFRRGKNKYDHIVEFEPIFKGLKISENLINSGIKLQNLSLGNAVTAVLKDWGNKYEYDKSEGGEFFWSELDSTEKGIYIMGWLNGSIFTGGEVFQIIPHIALENSDRFNKNCLVIITEGMLEISDILDTLRPDISRFYKEKYALISYIDKNVENGQADGQTIFARSTILSIAEGVKTWNDKK